MTDGLLLVAGMVFALVVALLVLFAAGSSIIAARKPEGSAEQALAGLESRAPAGEWMGRGIAIGLLIGMAMGPLLGVAIDNVALGISLGPSMGAAIGVAIGSALEQRHRDGMRPLTPEERRVRTWVLGISVGLGLLVLGVVLAAWLFLGF